MAEMTPEATVKKFLTVREEGSRQVQRNLLNIKRKVRSWKGEKGAAIGISNLMLHSPPFSPAIKRDFEELVV
jgi:hypothetical protein